MIRIPMIIANGTARPQSDPSLVPDALRIEMRAEECIVWQRGDALPEPTAAQKLEAAKAAKLARIDAETSAAILAGFTHTMNGAEYRFSYDTFDQQNFADAANAALLGLISGDSGQRVTWNGYKADGSLARLDLDCQGFLGLYAHGALAHKAGQMERGGRRKAAAQAAQTLAEVEAA